MHHRYYWLMPIGLLIILGILAALTYQSADNAAKLLEEIGR